MPSLCGSAYFYPRPPRGGRPSLAFSLLCNREISIHALREEGDGCSIDLGHIVDVFLSTPSARRATCCMAFTSYVGSISIHALCEEGDGSGLFWGCRRRISIHALCEEGDFFRRTAMRSIWLFLSTPSARRATMLQSTIPAPPTNFYPRPLRGGRLGCPAFRPDA